MSGKASVLFRVAAIAEACSWAALLVAMFFKYVVRAGEGGVPVVGMVHGVLFVVYVLITLYTARVLGWKPKILLLGLLASIPPLFTWWFESWAGRTGKLAADRASAAV